VERNEPRENAPLHDRIAIVTGASRGIGGAIALELGELGATVVVTARTVDPRADLAGTIGDTVQQITQSGGQALAIAADLLIEDDLHRLVREVESTVGAADILVNNAAYIGDVVFESFWEMDPQDWRNTMELNVNVPWTLSKLVAGPMRKRGTGLIVNLSSGVAHASGDGPLPGAGGLGAAYPASKAAVSQLSSFVGNELRAVGVTMVGLDPGFARSESCEILSQRLGIDPALAQPVEVAAKATGWLATHPDPLQFAGQVLVAREVVDAHHLLKL
jgi:NAD(P)-dependent dehydrogenase (short-subunit alcohol dehydrogenase family)